MPPKKRSAYDVMAATNRRKSSAGEKRKQKGRDEQLKVDQRNEPDTAIRIVEDEIEADAEMLNIPGSSASLSSIQYSTLLKPLKDITKSFSIDIEATLSQLLNDFTKAQMGSSNVRSTFATAGLILASCSDKYGKKVDHLLNMVRQLRKDVWDASVKRNQVEENPEKEEADDESDSGDCSDGEEEVSKDKQKSGKGLKCKNKFLSTAFKEVVFLSSKPKFYDDFMPLPFKEASTSVDMKELSLEIGNLNKPKLIARDLEVHLDIGRSRTSNYNVIDWRQESVGKIFDFFSQTSRIESGALILFQSALPSREKSVMMFDNAKQAGVLPDLDIDRPIRLQSPNSYHSFVDDASSNYAPSQYQNTLDSSSQTGNLSRQVSESAFPLDIAACLTLPDEKEPLKDPSALTPTDSCQKDFLSQSSETATLETCIEENAQNFDEDDEKKSVLVEVSIPASSPQSPNKNCSELKENQCTTADHRPILLTTEAATSIEVTKTNGNENISETSNVFCEKEENFLLLKDAPSPTGSLAETISLPPEDNHASPQEAQRMETAKSDSGMGTDSSDSSSTDNRAIINPNANRLILSSFAEDLRVTVLSTEKNSKSNKNENQFPVIICGDDFYKNKVSTTKSKLLSRICNENDDDLTLAQLAKLTPKSRKRILDVTDEPNPTKTRRIDLDVDTPSSSNKNGDDRGTSKFDFGSGLFFTDSISTNEPSTPQLPFECSSNHNTEKGYLSDECFSVVSHGIFPANHEEDCLPFHSKITKEAKTPSPSSNPVSPFSYRPFSPGFVAPGLLDSPTNSGFSTPEAVSESEPVVEEVDDRIESDNDLYQNHELSSKDINESFDECDETKKSYVSVKQWESKIGPLLKRQEKLPKFDVAKTSRDVVRNLKSIPGRTCNFSDQFNSSTQLYEVSRALVSCLGLASTMNIEIFPQCSGTDDFKIELKKNEENFADKDLLKLSEVEEVSSSTTKNFEPSKAVGKEKQEISSKSKNTDTRKSDSKKNYKRRTKQTKILTSEDEPAPSDSDSDFEL